MSFSLAKRFWVSRCSRSARRSERVRTALVLEPLEARWLLNATVITVSTAADDPTSVIAGQTTLRDAINQANQTTGATIQFAPSLAGQTIQPTAALPAITGAGTTINGLGANITLNGSKVPPIYHYPPPGGPGEATPQYIAIIWPDGLDIEASNVTIEGMTIVDWGKQGIHVFSAGSNVSNTNIVANNISNNGMSGIAVNASNTNIIDNTISGNAWDGVEIDGGSGNTIRGNSIFNNDSQAGVVGGGIGLIGANYSLAAPVLSSTNYSQAQGLATVTINGNLTLPSGAPNGAYTLEFFANTSNTNPQGQFSLGTMKVSAVGGATTPFSFTYSSTAIPGNVFTATVTDPNGDTSGFSNAVSSSQPPTPAPPVTANPLPSSFQAAFTLFMDGAEMLFDELASYANPNLAGVNASIAANLPYAGPFADWFVLAGEAAMAEHLSAAM